MFAFNMKQRVKAAVTVVAGMCLLAVSAQQALAESYTKGQHIEPAYEGWMQNPDGTFSFLFGYHNENWGEELDIPVGENNFFSPGEADRGQPTHFLPRRNRFTFKVQVPDEGWLRLSVGTKPESWTQDGNGSLFFVGVITLLLGYVYLLIRDLDMDLVKEMRDDWQFYRDRRPDSYTSIARP